MNNIYQFLDYSRIYGKDFGEIDMIPNIIYREISAAYPGSLKNIDDFKGQIEIKINGVEICFELYYNKDIDPDNCYLDASSKKQSGDLTGPNYQLVGQYTELEKEIKDFMSQLFTLS